MLISVSGKINSGKDTIGKILQILLNNPHLNNEGVLSFLKKDINFDSPYYKTWQIKKFADKLKDIVCLLLNVDRETLEDREFKEKELGEEWTCYKVTQLDKIINKCYLTEKEALTFIEYASKYYFKEGVDKLEHFKVIKVNMTPRLLLQLIGTECGRQILHPNIWCNSLMSEYVKTYPPKEKGNMKVAVMPRKEYPNWIITDIRFENELKAVKDKKGITIRVNRSFKHKVESAGGKFSLGHDVTPSNEHESETALDNAEFDYEINNDSSIEELIEKVREILIKEKLL